MKDAQFYVCGTPDAARQVVPGFDLPQRDAPFFIILFADGGVYVFPREPAIAMARHIVQAFNEIMRDGDILHQEASV